MTIAEVVSALQNDQPIVVRDKTFKVSTLEEIVLDTGEIVFWAHARDGLWLSVDPGSEEIKMFEDIDEEIEPEDDTVVYGGDDYEFSYEGSATLKDDEAGGAIRFREFENANGNIVRITEYEATADVHSAYGNVLTEEEIQEA
ncbi:MAG: hypothetical protein UY72_C0046G0004 [Candidatus Uhrbacteria bacterium GW2011_GWD2_52_7]|uniref:DUF4178 domain-containing protein n=1 Tax=Candidatus Uhrbacteria bacterium GW2011_GWD2_52_7 TaxID=1618989 RepID=A0A0G1XEL8_9BACT|nr:MAG: hypothetical protein UY72_C0046G0004 [Candidatus Uhrbacteria bacterium GW2011_GWD2_52_7]